MRQLGILLLLLCGVCLSLAAAEHEPWTPGRIEQLLQHAQQLHDPGEQIGYISQQLLNTHYQAHTLIGSSHTPEQLVARLDALDCMTFIENLEALRRSDSFPAYLDNLQQVRYKNAHVEFSHRNHFFADWPISNAPMIQDVTQLVAEGAAVSVSKALNHNGPKFWIPGIPVVKKTVHYLPASQINQAVLQRLRTGDFVGNYSELAGLDVNHVGIVIKKGEHVYFRHANADAGIRRVTDEDFLRFFKFQRGIVVFRAYRND